MTDSEQIEKWIGQYTDLQRIKSAPDRDAELNYQLSIAKANLDAMGIPTEKLDLN